MLRRSRHLLFLSLIGAVAVSCGSADTAPDATDLPNVAEFDASLAAALDNSQDVGALRVTSFAAQTLQIEDFGIDARGALDLDNPTAVVESDGNGSQHIVVDLTSQFAPMIAANPGLGDLGEIALEFWSTPEVLVLDTTGYSAIEEINPGQLGVFSPAVFTVDVERLGTDAGEEVVSLIAGSPVPDLGEVAAGLLEKLDAPVAQDDASGTFIGTMTFGELLEIQGTSSREAANSAASGLAAGLGVDGQVLADFYATFYDRTELDVVITIGEDDVLESITYEADLSGLYDGIGEVLLTSPTFSEQAQNDIDMQLEAFADAVFTLESKIVFEADDSIVVEAPTGDFEDRTDAMVAFFEQSGVDFSN